MPTSRKTPKLDERDLELLRAAYAPSGSAGVRMYLYTRDGVRSITLSEGEEPQVVGRAAPADIVVRDASLSRTHATVAFKEGKIWIEDLESTNGTWVDGERIDARSVEKGAAVAFGAVGALVEGADGYFGQVVEVHEAFGQRLASEVARARTFSRSAALLMVRLGESGRVLTSVLPAVCQALRDFDVVGLYSPTTVEVLLCEADDASADALAQRFAAIDPEVRVGFAMFPADARSAEEMASRALGELRRTRPEERVRRSSNPDGWRVDTSTEPPAGPIVAADATREVFRMAERISGSSLPVLILGETGVGKELVARKIHDSGPRAKAPICTVNCGAIAKHLVESTLFGHEKGAFTGAGRRSVGFIEAADGGTVFLDEIGELPLEAQASLLRVLETGTFTRIGSPRETSVNVRFVAATHRNLEQMVEDGLFRQDLLYRLNALVINVPPLRDRREEIGPLASMFLQEARRREGGSVRGIDPAALALLGTYNWPGNVRELRNVVERSVAIADGELVTALDLPPRLRDSSASAPAVHGWDGPKSARQATGQPVFPLDLREELQAFERRLIVQALDETGWKRSDAAELLGLPLRTLAHKIKTLEIDRG